MQARVLYVDDEIDNLKALQLLFQSEPFDLIIDHSPLNALNRIDHIQPAVVIADQRMPEMSGADFLAKVKRRHPATVRMMLTGYADFESAVEAINKGHVYSFIQKPWQADELKAKVRSALAHRESILGLRNIVEILADEILENQKDHKAIQKLAGAVYDDLSRPLMIIAGYTKLLQDSIADEEIPQRYLCNIMEQLRHIDALKNRIQSIARRLTASHGHFSKKVSDVIGSAERQTAGQNEDPI